MLDLRTPIMTTPGMTYRKGGLPESTIINSTMLKNVCITYAV